MAPVGVEQRSRLLVRPLHLQGVETSMRYVNLYLIGYAVFVIGVLLALWQANVLAHIDPIWVAIGLIVAVGVGIMFAVSGGKPTMTSE
jgi:hypothetical protein